jgi:hypothetical protein
LVRIQHAAEPDEILVSGETAASLPPDCADEPKGPGLILRKEPPGYGDKMPRKPRPQMSPEMVAQCLPLAIRTHVLGGGGIPEHRPVTIAFIHFEGTDALIEERGAPAAADALHRCRVVETARTSRAFVSRVRRRRRRQADTDRRTKATGNDEERMPLRCARSSRASCRSPCGSAFIALSSLTTSARSIAAHGDGLRSTWRRD